MIRIFLVDDDPSLRIALTKALSRKGFDVVDASGGEAAIEPLKSGIGPHGPIDICVLDLRMPGMTGLEVLRRTPQRKVPTVVLTGHGTVPDAVEAMRLGAADFVQKPVDADELAMVLQKALAQEQSPPGETSTPQNELPRAGQRVTLEELEKKHIVRLLDELHNVPEVARIVGIDRRTLQRKMIAWGLRSAEGSAAEGATGDGSGIDASSPENAARE